MPQRYIIFAAGCIMSATFLGCTFTPSSSDIAGRYVGTHSAGEEQIFLTSNGTFRQLVRDTISAITNASTGTWSYDEKTGYVIFSKEFMQVLDGNRKYNPDYQTGSKGLVVLPVAKILGRFRLGSDERVLYKKTDVAVEK